MTEAEKAEYLTYTAKELRRDLWRSGHEDVHSHIEKVTKEKLDEYVKHENNEDYDDMLDQDQISDLYRCHYRKTCELHLINVSGSYWGGYGVSAHFILLDTLKRKHYEIAHTAYAE